MDKKTARRIGIRKALSAAIIAFLLLELLLFIQETHGDLANGLLFFMQAQASPVIVGAFLILFLPVLLLGGRAGVEVILLGRKPILVGIKFAVIMTAIPILIWIGIFRSYNLTTENENTKALFWGPIVVITIAQFFTWIVCALRIRLTTKKQ